MREETVSIQNQTKGTLPTVPFVLMKDKILGSTYEISIAFVSPKKAAELNTLYRQKDYTPDILSFPLTENSGEMILCASQVKKNAIKHDFDYQNYLSFLVIHGMLHLKGYEHGSKMESEEEKYKKIFKISSLPHTH